MPPTCRSSFWAPGADRGRKGAGMRQRQPTRQRGPAIFQPRAGSYCGIKRAVTTPRRTGASFSSLGRRNETRSLTSRRPTLSGMTVLTETESMFPVSRKALIGPLGRLLSFTLSVAICAAQAPSHRLSLLAARYCAAQADTVARRRFA